jgi:starch synthase
LKKSDVELLKNPTFVNVSKAIIDLADGVIKGSPKINSDIEKYIKKSGKPVLDFKNADEYLDAYSEFYDAVLEEVVEMVD